MKKILLANPRGFCSGVKRAIALAHDVLTQFPPLVYALHEIVHNHHVVEDLKRKGICFVDTLEDVPENSPVIFSAHGVSPETIRKAESRHLHIFDATCPLVEKVHQEVIRCAKNNLACIMIGHRGHPEVMATMAHYLSTTRNIHLVETLDDAKNLPLPKSEPVFCTTQTTLSVRETQTIIDYLAQHFPNLQRPKTSDICYATEDRQAAVAKLAAIADTIVVLGSKNSSNSNRLRELAAACGRKAFLVDDYAELDAAALVDTDILGVTAGASAPETIVQRFAERCATRFDCSIEEMPSKKR